MKGRIVYEVASYDPSPWGPLKPLNRAPFRLRWVAAVVRCWREINNPCWYHTCAPVWVPSKELKQ